MATFSSQSFSLLMWLMSVIQAGRPAVDLFVDSVQDQLLHHPGHGPSHVTRLHRYEHAGVTSMLEEEAKWHQEVKQIKKRRQSGSTLKDVRRIRGSAAPEEVDHAAGFLKLSAVQAKALHAQHEPWTAFLQSMADSAAGSDMYKDDGAPNKSLLQKFKAFTSAWKGNHSKDAVVATSLSQLSSQYVGPIGVGTVADPPGCEMRVRPEMEMDSSRRRTALAKASGFNSLGTEPEVGILSKMQHFFSLANVSSKQAEEEGKEIAEACSIQDQSKVWVVLDTGSTNIWIMSDLCAHGPCRLPGRRIFNHSRSQTFSYRQPHSRLDVQFGTGKMGGPQAMEDFRIGPFTVYNQTFAMVESQNGDVFKDVAFEGIVGLAFDTMSANGVEPFFDSIIRQKAMKHNEFAFYFSKDKPSSNAVFWGGVDPMFYEGDLQYFPVIDPYYWSLKLVDFKIGNDVLIGADDVYQGSPNTNRRWNGPVAVVDTGTTFFTFHDKNIIMQKLPSTTCSEVTDQSHPPITITLENTLGMPIDFVMTNKDYMTASGSGKTANCAPAFMELSLPEEHGPGMVLGEVFLRHFFGVFDRAGGQNEDARVAFARSANGDDRLLARLHDLTADQPLFAAGPPQ